MERIVNDPQEKQWGMFTHLSAFATFVLPVAGNIIGPLIIYLIKKDEYEFVNDQGKEVLNFQITWSIIFAISIILIFAGIGILMLIGFGIAWLVLVIVGSVAASNGQYYRYPFTIKFFQ
ncbi:DUF4870 domain-containing protein [Prolixibacteraceae bacterium Z1-6]|uniref:DUF4870 domain-containing protein n=1 Tax=Draconibacterium aestuarii TaxID=2998507 RepID=A0A9X3J637_9BACT|nr:DUF4870 domain-containing protein [Prolixibacteraceae bacterium Z1-6]